jgi:hypothetical protein
VVDPQSVLQLAVLLFDGPPAAHERDQLAQRGARVEVEQIVFALVVGSTPAVAWQRSVESIMVR